jgi:hypothetical protein
MPGRAQHFDCINQQTEPFVGHDPAEKQNAEGAIWVERSTLPAAPKPQIRMEKWENLANADPFLANQPLRDRPAQSYDQIGMLGIAKQPRRQPSSFVSRMWHDVVNDAYIAYAHTFDPTTK